MTELTTALTRQEEQALQEKLMDLLAWQVRRYTHGESSSVPVETAQALLDSLCLTLGLDSAHPAERGRALLAQDLQTALAAGQDRLRAEMVRGKALWAVQRRAQLPGENRTMFDTLGSIGGFWRRYDPVYRAQEIPCDIDYQLALPVPETKQGVHYVNEYLARLTLENRFLGRYAWEDLTPVWERYHPWYREEVCNLFQPVAVNALGKAVLGAAPVPLTMTAEEREALANCFRDRTREEIVSVLSAAARTLAGAERDTAAYLTACACDLAGRLFALEDGSGVWL